MDDCVRSNIIVRVIMYDSYYTGNVFLTDM